MQFGSLSPWTWGKKSLPVKREEEHPVYLLQRDMNRLFEDFFRGFDVAPFYTMEEELGSFSPRVDLKETEAEIVISAELPGMEEKDLGVSLLNDVLTIVGEKKEEKEEKVKGHYKMERSYGSFRRSLALPTEVDSEKVNAVFKNGVLTITLPKAAELQKKVKTIPVKKEEG